MQFRERRRVIQVIRTTYDPALKRGRAEVVGRIDKATLIPGDKLWRTCSGEEANEIRRFLALRTSSLRDEAVRAGAETLPERMRAAAEYFRTHDDDEARRFAGEIRSAWSELKSALRKAGFTKDALPQSVTVRARRKAAQRGGGDGSTSNTGGSTSDPLPPRLPTTSVDDA